MPKYRWPSEGEYVRWAYYEGKIRSEELLNLVCGLDGDTLQDAFGSLMNEDHFEYDAEELWLQLADIPTTSDDEIPLTTIDVDFLDFKEGTDIEEIHRWFEETFNMSIHELSIAVTNRLTNLPN